ncbi:hypothetical protein [Streptomyces sp. NPDC021622]|uniref:hypothetical protein n=1 Tax=Streptomyces sp. NPDC021622 TaxID=3155013 RepID=UPI0033C42028
MKKLKAIGVTLFASALVATGSGFAHASSGWDYRGASTFKNRDVELHLWFRSYVHSGGGSFMACVDPTSDTYTYALWEYDKTESRKVSSKRSNGGCLTFKNIGDYVDGSNNKAEFMLSTANPEGGDGVTYWD